MPTPRPARRVASAVSAPVLTTRAINRATLARQLLLERTTMPLTEVLEHLVGLQAQTPHTAYVGLWSRLTGFRPADVSGLMLSHEVVRIALMRSTIFLVTARDAWALRPLIQVVHDRMFQGQFGRRLEGLDRTAILAAGRAYLEVEPRTFKALGEHLVADWPGRDHLALEMLVRTGVPLVQVPPRGLWGRSGAVKHTSIEAWLGERPVDWLTVDALVLRYLRAFGPASVMDAQTWCGLTKLREVFERLRPELVVFRDEQGRELFDLPDAPPGSGRAGSAAVPVRLREHAALVRGPLAGDRPGARAPHRGPRERVDQHVPRRRVRRRDVEGGAGA